MISYDYIGYIPSLSADKASNRLIIPDSQTVFH